MIGEPEYPTCRSNFTDADWRRWRRQVAVYNRWLIETMTLGGATAVRRANIGCACTGEPACCLTLAPRQRELHRAAHIVVKQLADLVERRRP